MIQPEGSRGLPESSSATTRPSPESPPSLRARLMFGGFWALSGKVLAGITIIATNMTLARLLSPAELGGYFLALSMISIAATVAPLGLNRAVVRFVAESVGAGQPAKARAVIGQALYFGIGGSLTLAAVMYVGLGDWLAREVVRSRPLASSVGLIAAWIVPAAAVLLFAEIFRGFHDIRNATVHGGLLGNFLALAVFIVVYLYGGRMSLQEVTGVSLVSTTIGAAVAVWVLRKRVKRLPRAPSSMPMLTMLKASLPLFVTTTTVLVLSQADLWILGIFWAQQDVAIYAAAAKLMIVVSIPLAIVNAVIQPLIAEYYSQRRYDELQRLLRVTATLAALPAIGVLICAMLFASPTLALLYGDIYASGAEVLTILALGQMVNVWTGSCAVVLMMTGHERALMVLTGVTSILSVVLMITFAGPFGIIGVAVASAVGVSLQNGALWIAARQFAGVWTNMGLRGLHDVLRLLRGEVGRRRDPARTQPLV